MFALFVVAVHVSDNSAQRSGNCGIATLLIVDKAIPFINTDILNGVFSVSEAGLTRLSNAAQNM